MAVITKPGVVFKGFTFDLLTILDTLVWLDAHKVPGQPENIVITSANDSRHKAGSKHYSNQAVDIRIKSFDPAYVPEFLVTLKKELGENFTVLHESVGTPNAHVHIQKRKAT